MKYSGLSDAEVKISREKNGNNAIPDSEPTTFWDEFKETFGDPMIKILLVIAGIMIVMFFFGYAEIYEPVGTIVAVIIVAIVSAKTGVASDTAYRKLKEDQKKDTCKVYRNGMVSIVDVDDVVVGDKVLLQSGDKIPADGILIDGDLRVDNSALNGEAEECKKFATAEDKIFAEEITGDVFVDEYSLFRGSVVFDGEGVLDVRKVGLNSMMGKMAGDMQDEGPDSPLKVKLEDEVTTGNTIVKLIDSIKCRFPNISVSYSILSILNSMPEDRIEELKKQGITCLYVVKIPFEYKIDSIIQYDYSDTGAQISEYGYAYEEIKVGCMNLRYVHERYKYKEAILKYVNEVVSKYQLKNEHKILVLGTEEFMFPPLMVAERIEKLFPDKEIRFHATTRSPILVSESGSYPLNKRNKLSSCYEDDRTTYVYNLSDYDVAIILTDSSCVSDKSVKSICGAIYNSGCKRIIIGKE